MDTICVLLIERTQADLARTREYLSHSPDLRVIGGCTTVEQAYAFCCVHHPDIIICELVLLGANALTLLNRLSRRPDKPLFLLTSSLASDSVLQSATECGADYFLRKPYLPEELTDAVAMMIRQRPALPDDSPAADRRGIYRLLVQRGYTSNTHGFHYLATGIHLGLENPELLANLTKQLYVQIAEVHHTHAFCVERNIRHAIRSTSQRTGAPQLTNGDTLRHMVQAIRTERKRRK